MKKTIIKKKKDSTLWWSWSVCQQHLWSSDHRPKPMCQYSEL